MNSFALVDHLGWVLIHSLWQFTAISLVAGLIVWMLRRSTSTARYAVWVIAMGWAVTAPGVTWMVLPLEEPAVAAAIPQADDLAIFPVPAEPVAEAPPLPADVTLVGDVVPVNAVVSEPLQVAAVPITETISRPTWSETLTAILHPWMAWIVAGWCAGVGLCSLRPLLGWHMLWRLRMVGVAPVSDDIRTALRRVSDRLRLRQTVQVLQSTLSQVPVVVGYLRPVILLPVSLLTNMPPSQLEAILAHELAHIRRHDFIVNLLQTLVETLFFYHPAVWWLSRQIRVEREHCCDDLVVAALDNRVEYGRALLAIEELRGERTLLVLGAHDGSLLSRIRRIVGFHADRTASSPWMSLVFVTCLFSVIGLVSVLGWTASAENQPDTAIEIIDNDESDVKKTLEPPKPVIAEWSENRSIEFVGITKNTAPAKDGWLPSGLPMGDVPNWKSTIVLHGGNTSSSFTEGKPHPEPDADAIDFLFRFRGLKAQPSLTFDMPTRSSSYSNLPVTDPYELRVSARRRGPPPPGGQWSSPDGVVRVGLTDEPWGRYVKISPAGEVVDPIQPHELYASTYKLIDVQGSQPHDRISTGKAILIREPSAHIDPDNPDHRYVFEFRAIDTDGKEHWAIQWEGRGVERTQWVDSQYGLAQPLPAGKTLSHYEYRLRPFRHWITFENVSIEPGPQTDVKSSVRSWPAVPSTLKVTNVDGSPATFNAVGVAQVGFPLKPMRPWLGWPDRNGVVSLEALPFGTHWILAAGDFEQRTIFSLAYPTGESRIERKLWAREPWTKHDLEFKTRFEPDEKTGGDIVVTIKNKFDKPLMLSEADFSLHVGELAMYRVMSPMWASGSFRIREIAGGQTGEVRLNWNDWVRKGFWATREGEGISEPTLPPNEPGRIYVRVCLGNSGALPIAVTDPAVMLAEAEPEPFLSIIVGEKRRFQSPMRIRQVNHFSTRAATTFNEDPQTVIVTGQSAGFTVLSLENEHGEWYHAPIEVIEGKPPKYAERVTVTFTSKTAPSRTIATLLQEKITVPMFRGVSHNLEFPDPIARVEGLDDTHIQCLPGGKQLHLLGLAFGKSTFVVKTKHEDDETVQSWPVELQVNELSRDRLQEWMRDLKTEKPPLPPRLLDSSKSAAVVDEQLKAIANRFVEALKERELSFLAEAHFDALFNQLHQELVTRVTHRQDRKYLEQVFYAIDDHVGNVHLKPFATAENFMRDYEILKCHLWMALDRDELTKEQQDQRAAQYAWYIEFAESFEKGKPERFVGFLDENTGRRMKMRYDEFFLNQLRRMLNDPFNPYVAWPLTDKQFAEAQRQIRRPEWLVVKEPSLETITSIVFHAIAEQQAKRVAQRWPIPNEMAVWGGFGKNRWRYDEVKANHTLASLIDETKPKPEKPNDAAVNGKPVVLPIAVTDPAVMLQEQAEEQTPSQTETKQAVQRDQQDSAPATPANQAQIDQMVRENGITKLTLVYFQDQDRRTIPAVMLGYDLETHIVTSGLAGFGLDHVPAAVDRTFLVDAKGKSVDVEYHSGSRPGTFVYCALPGLVSANRKEPALLAVGDPVTAISIDAKGDFSGTLNAATVTALNTTAVINHRRLGERQYSGLIELNAPLLEGTLILKQGTLVGIVEVSTRFLGPESQKCYAVPFNSMQALSKELAAAKANANAAGERRRVALMKSVVTITRVEASTAEPKPKPNRRSGVVVDDRGYILAMYYPGDTPGDGFQIRLNDQSEHSAKVVATDQNLSVALLQISPRKPLKAISLDNLSTAKSGEPVTAIFADRWPSIMAGNVTGVGVELDINSTMIMKNLIETNVMINPGDGGSLLANADDQPLGVWHAIRVGKQRISFAIPLAEIVPFVSANLPVRQPAGAQDEPKEDPEKDERTSLLESLIQQPKLETFQKLLALADGKHPPPTELLDDSRRHSGKEKMGGEVRVISNGQERFAIVSAKVIPIIEPSDVAIRVDPERRAECAFVFDMQGRLIDTIGGKLAGGNSLGGDNIHVVNLGPEEDWFIRVMNFEKRGELNYRSDYYRIANPVVKSMRFYNLPNACSWSNGPEKIPRQGRLHPAHPQAQRPSYAGIPNAIPVTTAAGVPTVSAIVWDGDRNRFVAAPSAFVKGLPLYEVDTTWSREFEPLEPQVGQLAVEGGIREYDHWYAWEAAVPDQGNSVTVLTLPQRDGPAKVIEKKLAPGRHTVQLQAKPQDNGPGMQLKLWIDDDQKYDFDLPFALGEALANHPPIVNVLKPSESVRLVHRLLKDTTAALLFEIKLQPTSDAETSTTNANQTRGTLKGRFVYDGDAPKPRDLHPELSKLDKDSEVPRDSAGRPIGTAMWYMDYLKAGIRPKTEDASLLVDKDGGIANIVVWVTSKEIPRTPKDNWLVPAMIYVKDGHFTPRIRLLTREQPLLVENADPVSFTFATSFQRNTNVNALLAPAADKKPFRINLAQVEPFPQPYRSNVATWANGYIFVRDNDYVTISQPDGTFTLPDLPPGEWEFRTWHERRGYLEHWPKGTFRQKIQPGDNDLGTIKLKPAFFEPREVNP
ncbi:MAG: M56 family metallopeptidase [Planctomycetaceae bacterium]|nr:M56 family metallopeptidase [Planctomycetaceae bacterium]